MRKFVCLIALFLTGCQSLQVLDWDELGSPAIMPLWQRYQQCLVSADPETLLSLVVQFDQVALTGSEPPAWMKVLSQEVKRQPLRTSIDPYALGAACTIKTAAVLVQHKRIPEATSLYQRVLSRYDRQDWAYYYEQAEDSLAALPEYDPAVVALRGATASFHVR